MIKGRRGRTAGVEGMVWQGSGRRDSPSLLVYGNVFFFPRTWYTTQRFPLSSLRGERKEGSLNSFPIQNIDPTITHRIFPNSVPNEAPNTLFTSLPSLVSKEKEKKEITNSSRVRENVQESFFPNIVHGAICNMYISSISFSILSFSRLNKADKKRKSPSSYGRKGFENLLYPQKSGTA